MSQAKLRNRAVFATSLLSLSIAVAAGGCKPDLPQQPDFDTNKGCSAAGHGEPLVVDWQPGQRVDLEAAMKQGVALVHYDCKSIRLVRGCRIDGGYGFMATTTKEEVVRLVNSDEVRANLPLSGGKLGADLHADFQRGASLDIALVMIGKKATTWRTVKSSDLKGDDCGEVTHFIASASLGAFVMQTGQQAQAKTAVELFNAGGGVATKNSKHVRNTDGIIDECKKASPDSDVPPQQCGAPLRLELVPLADRVPMKEKSPTPAASSAAAPKGEQAVVPTCPEGFALSGGKCVKATEGATFACKGDNAKECEAQCQKKEPNSCYSLAKAFRYGTSGVAQNLTAARDYYKVACEGGIAASCVDFGVTLEHGMGGGQDLTGAYMIYKKACENGDSVGCTWLGTLYRNGRGVEKNSSKAAKFYQTGCNGGHPTGCTFLGTVYESGDGAEKDLSKAMRLYEQGCQGNDGQACGNLAEHYESGKGVERDELQSFKYYVKSCSRGYGISCTRLGDRYLSGKGIPPEGREGKPVDNAIDFYERACSGNPMDAEGCNKLGVMANDGKVVKKNPELANKFFDKGCKNGSGYACQNLAYNVYAGNGTKADKPTAAGIMKAACELGTASSCTQLGQWYQRGDGVSRDSKLSATYWDKGCAAGDRDACLLLGIAYQYGNGVAKKPENAAKLYAMSCTSTEVTGCLNLGVLYYFGNGVAKNYAEAFKLFKHGCSRGDRQSCMNSGIMEMHGEGTTKDESKAVEQFRELCDRQNFMPACGTLGYLARYGKGFAKDPARAVSYSERACSGGDLDACANLAMWLDENPAAKKDEIDRSFSLFQRACDGNNSGGCAFLGYMYERGRGVTASKERAVNLYRRACDEGNPTACSSLELVQELGTNGVPASPVVAAIKFEQQCNKKDARACSQAAFQSYLGRGTKRDRDKAVSLLHKACDLGEARSCEQLKLMVEAQKK